MELVYNEIVRRQKSGLACRQAHRIGGQAGFTLMELMLVIAIIMILSVIGIGSYTQATVKSRDTQRKNDLSQIAKALELFNNDVGRYPKVTGGKMTCPLADGSEEDCSIAEIYAYIKSVKSSYIKPVPSDSTSGKVYVYVPDASFGSYALYAALENSQDRDWVKTAAGVATNWDSDGVMCGTAVSCNYKLIETGLVRTK